jgi:hypothetical protein
MKEREQDSKRELEQSRRNQELIDSSKPKAKAAKQADGAKKAKATKMDAAKKAKTVARSEKENRKKKQRKPKRPKEPKQKGGNRGWGRRMGIRRTAVMKKSLKMMKGRHCLGRTG